MLHSIRVAGLRMQHAPFAMYGGLVDGIGRLVPAVSHARHERPPRVVAGGGHPVGHHVLLLRRVPGMQLADGAVLKAAGAGGPPRVAGDHGSDAARLASCPEHLCVQPGADVGQPIRVHYGLQPRRLPIRRVMQLHWGRLLQLKPEVKRHASRLLLPMYRCR
jgi:hypothetical protein